MFDSALELNRNDIRSLINKGDAHSGVVLIKLGKVNEAIIIYNLALSLVFKNWNTKIKENMMRHWWYMIALFKLIQIMQIHILLKVINSISF